MGLFDQNIADEGLLNLINQSGSSENLTLALIDLAEQHSLVGLLYERVSGARRAHVQKKSVEYQVLRKKAMLWEAVAMVRMDALKALLSEAKSRNLSIVLIKGTALAYQLYQSPGLRPCFDIDVFISQNEIIQVRDLFCRLGYDVEPVPEKSTICFQFCASQKTESGQTIVFDIHYRINNQAKYAGLFEFSDVLANSVSVPQICPSARALCVADAYILACVHLQGHFLSGDTIRAIWLYDIHLMLESMNQRDLEPAIAYISSRSVALVCHRWTSLTRNKFKTKVPEQLLVNLAATNKQNLSRIDHRVNPVRRLWDQFYYQPNNRARLRFIKQLFIPSKQRIIDKYPDSNQWIPILYLRRALTGLWKRLAKIGA